MNLEPDNLSSYEKPFISSRRLLLICLSAFLAITFFGLWLQTDSASRFRQELKERLRKKLVSIDQLPPETTADVIYILGGSQNSLKLKFKTASDLYNKGICKRILILSRPEKTEYNSFLGRNLTNDEWAIWKLEELGIPKNSVEPISITKGFFGTFAEAKSVSKLAKKRDYENMVLISTPYHTRRVRISFKKFLKNQNVSVYACPACPVAPEDGTGVAPEDGTGVKFFKKDSGADLSAGIMADLTGVQASDKRGSLTELIIEFIKLKIYQYFLFCSDDQKTSNNKSLAGLDYQRRAMS